MMKIYKCLIVDDEPIARSIVENYCRQLPYLEVISSSKNAMEAKLALQQHKIDILFLDINMPVIDGISLLKTLRQPPQVIFTTAYREFALEGFDLAACDYLLKPFSIERFMVAVDKAIDKLSDSGAVDTSEETSGDEFVFIKTDGKIFRILLRDVLYAEANGNYTRIFTTRSMLMPAMTFASAEEILHRPTFTRVHRSFIINKSYITHIEGNRVYIDKKEIPIGSNYKDSFFKELGLSS